LGGHLLTAFGGLILIPLILAWLTESAADKRPSLARLVHGLAWLPIPLLALVVFLIAASQVQLVIETSKKLWTLLPVFVLYLLAAAVVGKFLGRWFGLAAGQARTLVFSLGTRNSFVILPLALSLPEAWSPAVVVVVFQSLVELFGMLFYLHWVPRFLVPAPTTGQNSRSGVG